MKHTTICLNNCIIRYSAYTDRPPTEKWSEEDTNAFYKVTCVRIGLVLFNKIIVSMMT
jgi:hypothetical protein